MKLKQKLFICMKRTLIYKIFSGLKFSWGVKTLAFMKRITSTLHHHFHNRPSKLFVIFDTVMLRFSLWVIQF